MQAKTPPTNKKPPQSGFGRPGKLTAAQSPLERTPEPQQMAYVPPRT